MEAAFFRAFSSVFLIDSSVLELIGISSPPTLAEGLKLLAIDGVTPNADSIRSGAYPFLNPYYVVMSAGQAEDSPTGILFQWLLGDEGQSLIAHEGYVSIKE